MYIKSYFHLTFIVTQTKEAVNAEGERAYSVWGVNQPLRMADDFNYICISLHNFHGVPYISVTMEVCRSRSLYHPICKVSREYAKVYSAGS